MPFPYFPAKFSSKSRPVWENRQWAARCQKSSNTFMMPNWLFICWLCDLAASLGCSHINRRTWQNNFIYKCAHITFSELPSSSYSTYGHGHCAFFQHYASFNSIHHLESNCSRHFSPASGCGRTKHMEFNIIAALFCLHFIARQSKGASKTIQLRELFSMLIVLQA